MKNFDAIIAVIHVVYNGKVYNSLINCPTIEASTVVSRKTPVAIWRVRYKREVDNEDNLSKLRYRKCIIYSQPLLLC